MTKKPFLQLVIIALVSSVSFVIAGKNSSTVATDVNNERPALNSTSRLASPNTSKNLVACTVKINKVVVSDCFYDATTQESQSAVEVEVSWDETEVPGNQFNTDVNAPRMDSIEVRLGNQVKYIYLETGAVNANNVLISYKKLHSPQVVTFFLTADGSSNNITANFHNTPTCQTSSPTPVVLPSGCASNPCVSGLGVIGGNIYEDFNANGTKDATETVGLNNVEVNIYACDANGGSTLIGTKLSDDYGDYQFANLDDSKKYRIEFKVPASYDFYKPTLGSTSSYTTVQYASTQSCDINLGLTNPANSCGPLPNIITACYVKGSYNGQLKDLPTIVMAPYGVSDADGSRNTYYGTHGQTGAVWGIAYDAKRNLLYSSAVLKRHVGLGPLGLGGVYVTDLNQPAAAIPTSNFVDLDAGGLAFNFGVEPVRDFPPILVPPAASTDGAAFSKVGKVGIGDIDYDSFSETLFLTNLEEKRLYEINVQDYQGPGTNTEPDASKVRSYKIPDPGCTGGEYRPWAVKVYDGFVYVGVTCDASLSQDPSDLRSKIYKFDILNSAFNTTPVLDFPLTYPKGYPDKEIPTTGEWQAWEDDIQNFSEKGFFDIEIQPILSDIEFDTNGDIILAIMDRSSALQIGNGDRYPDGSGEEERGVAGGDILRAMTAGETFVLENNGRVGNITGSGANNFQGPGFGEFYNDNFIYLSVISHAEIGLGALALAPGSGQVIASFGDPVDNNIFSNGFRILNNTTGESEFSYSIFRGADGSNDNSFGKGGGLGDMEVICITPSQLEVGNYFWYDVNGDGIQDQCEPPVEGVSLSLYAADGITLLGTTVTAANGEWYFNNSNVNQNGAQGLAPDTQYIIRVSSTLKQGPLTGFSKYTITSVGPSNPASTVDNNANLNGQFSFRTTNVNDHSLDIGVLIDKCPYPNCGTVSVRKN